MEYNNLFDDIIAIRTDKVVNSKALIDQWRKAKRKLYEMFGNKLTVEIPVELTPGEDDISKAKKEFLDAEPRYSENLEWLTNKEFSNNKISKKVRVRDKEFQRGTKLTKILKCIAITPIETDRIQTKYSMAIQNLKVKGIACLSIDPIDYLTMSENKNNWRSCHALDGEYQGGNLSYMVDEFSVVAYIKSKSDVDLGGYEWNNKKWRQLVYINVYSRCAFFSKQYPYVSEPTSKVIRKMTGELMARYYEIEPSWKLIRGNTEIAEYVDDNDRTLHYNDIVENYGIEISAFYMKEGGLFSKTMIGDIPVCPICGKNKVTESEELVCCDCANYVECNECGAYIRGAESVNIHDKAYCYDCYDNIFVYCDVCGELFHEHNDKMTETKQGMVCPDCLETEGEDGL